VTGACLYCGNADPHDAYVHQYALDGSAHRIWCTDAAACERRQAEAATRYTITTLGRAVLAASEPRIFAGAQPGKYACPSGSRAGVTYTLTVELGSRVTCTCPGFEHYQHCKHGDQLARVLSGRAVLCQAVA
jgi:hypothetical protein